MPKRVLAGISLLVLAAGLGLVSGSSAVARAVEPKVVAAGRPSARGLAITIKLKPAKLRITKLRITTTRTSTSSTTRVDNVKPGTLTFKVRSRKVV